MHQLEGKVALITGGGRGQGRSHAVALAEAGAAVVVCDIQTPFDHLDYTPHRPGDLDATVAAVEAVGGKVHAAECDVRDLAGLEALVAAATEQFGGLDVVVANAGICSYAPVHEMSSGQWAEIIDVNLTGAFNTIRAAGPALVARGGGSIVTIASAVGKMGVANNPAYVASKWGVIGLTKSAAADLGRHNIRVNAVCPGYISTEMINNGTLPPLFFPGADSPTEEMVDEVIKQTSHMLPVARIEPAEVSKAVVFLASEESAFVSGSTLDVNAGWSFAMTA